MDQVNPQAVAKSLQQNVPLENLTHTPTEIDNKVFGGFWAYMANYYGSVFLSQYGEDPNPLWHQELQQFTRKELWAGVSVMKELNTEFPPSLAALISYCKNGKPKSDPDVCRPMLGASMPQDYERPELTLEQQISPEEARAQLKHYAKEMGEDVDTRVFKSRSGKPWITYLITCPQCGGSKQLSDGFGGIAECYLCDEHGMTKVCK